MRNAAPAIGLVERLLHLKKLRPLAALPAADIAVLADHVEERFFPKGSVLLREGEPVSALQVLVDGRVRCTRAGKLLGEIGPGDGAVGGFALFARAPEGIEARAVTDVLALQMESDTFLEILEDRFVIALHVLRDVCGQLVDVLSGQPPQLALARSAARHPAIPDRDLNLVERLLFLRQSPVFERASLNALAVLSRGMVETTFAPGETLWRAGDTAGTVHMVVSGTATAAFPGGERVKLGPGSPLGSLESLAARPRWYTAVADGKLVTLRGDVHGLIDVMEDNFDMAEDFFAVLSRWMLACLESTPEADLRAFFGCACPRTE